jgi:4-hydroxybenzoate polyprenyltransferase/phosphoserine phosphatase
MTAQEKRADGPGEKPVLVVDLDGTLIRSDMLYESFWAGLSESWRTVPLAMRGLARGKAQLKARLANLTPLDPAALPYNPPVLDYIRAWRAEGGRTALVSATNTHLVQTIAAHVALFDEAFGSDGETNLKGARKAAFLTERYGEKGYAYIGDSSADLPVWQGAAKAITVDIPASLSRQVKATAPEVETLTSGVRPGYLAALRPHQWIKNILVFVPAIAAHDFSPQTVLLALLAFASFSLVSSCGYVLNDLMDLKADRAHPRKCRRPLASGRVPLAHGTVMVPLLLLGGLGLAALGGWPLFGVMVLYFLLTSLYSFALKQVAIADIGTLAGLYTLRIIAGALATGVELSVWLLAFSMFFFFALAAIKRQGELVDLKSRGVNKPQRRGYSVDDLPLVQQMSITSGYLSVLVLALYLNAPAVQQLYSAPWLLWGICLVLLYWISRLALKTHRGLMLDDPIVYALRDTKSLICVGLMAGFAVAAAVL